MIKTTMKRLATVVALSVTMTGASHAATLSGIFNVTLANATGLTGAQSEATVSDANDAVAAGAVFDSFTYDGALDFGTFNSSDSTTISQWLASGGGTVSGLDAAIGGLQLSKPSISSGTATTTFFQFTLAGVGAGDFTIRHDDGITVYDAWFNALGGFDNPTSVRTTEVNGFDGGVVNFLYVATNGDPSVLEVDFTPVPVPAALPMLLLGLGGLGLLRRRARA